MANTQAVLLMCYRMSRVYDQGDTDIGPIAMVKAWVTERTREICRWGREVCGGNGLLHENYVMWDLADITDDDITRPNGCIATTDWNVNIDRLMDCQIGRC